MCIAVLALLFLSAMSGFALADVWTDISDATWQSVYHVSAADAFTVAEGYPDGTFRPNQSVTRGQFAKMVADGLDIPLLDPPIPTFTDVPRDYIFYKYIEGAVAAGVISGYPDGTFRPENNILRQQTNNILGSWLAQEETATIGGIQGADGFYSSLAAWFAAEGQAVLSQFADGLQVSPVHRPATAYLVMRGVVLGSSSGGALYLKPLSELSRVQAVTMVLRTRDVVFEADLPTVTNVNPAAGPTAGGNSVVITGTGFGGLSGASAVRFGTVNATSYVVNSVTQITAVAPAGTAGTTVDVTVTTPAGTSAVSAAGKYSYGIPTVTLLAPPAGPPAGGTSVVITGTGFTGLSGAAAVKFGTVNATSYVVNSATQITAVAPAGTAGTTVDVTVTTPAGTSATSAASKYSYGIPTVTLLNPAAGVAAGGTSVVITGTNFIDVTAVKFGTVNATSYVVNSVTQITAVAPAGTAGTTVDVTVTTAAGTSAVSAASKYSYGIPTVTLLNPAAGAAAGGNSVVITGTGFTGLSGAAAVKFGLVNATSYVVDSVTQITAVAPAGTAGTTVDVTVTTAAGTSAASAASKYSYGIPTVTLLAPTAGPPAGGTSVVITGTGFAGLSGAAAVKFGTVNATSYVVNSATQITALAPAGTLGTTVDVTVTTAAGTSAVSAASKYSYGPPATAPSAIVLALGATNPVGAVVNVAIPAAGATDNTGKVTGWVATTADRIKFTVTDAGAAVSTITINAVAYISGNDYMIAAAGTLTIVVTTTETGKAAGVRTFTVAVTASPATAPSAIVLARGATNPVGAVVNVAIPAAGATDTTGKVTGWVATTADRIKFTVTDAGAAVSTITVNAAAYISGNDYVIAAAAPLTVVVTTTETGKTTGVRTFTISVAQTPATAPSAIVLALGATNPVGAVVNVAIPAAGATDTTGKVTGWVATTADRIKFTVTDAGAAVSTITVNAVAYISGNDYIIAAAGTLTIVVTTTEAGKATGVRTFTVAVTA